jgi:hypothetical protein
LARFSSWYPGRKGGGFSVILNKGAGTFYQLPSYNVGDGPECILAKDFNKDGFIDLVTTNTRDSNISVLLGKNDGTFETKTQYAVGTRPTSIIADDFNNDGIFDLAVTNEGSGTLSILFGNNNGTFQDAIEIKNGYNPNSITSGDFNNDGIVDLVVSDAGGTNGGLLIYKGTGYGTYQFAPIKYGLGWASTTFLNRLCNWVTCGDFNNDGKLDVAATAYGTEHSVAIFLGNGNMTFQEPSYCTTGGYPSYVATGDFNEDGIIDFATADAGQNFVSVFIGKGDGTFNAGIKYNPGGIPVYLAINFVNNDKHQDIVVANVYSNNITILYGKGDGTFDNFEFLGKSHATSIAISDFNIDGKNDIAVGSYSSVVFYSKSFPHNIPSQIYPANEILSYVRINSFPNPTSGKIEFSLNELNESDYIIEMYNNNGGLIKTIVKNRKENKIILDLSDYPIGLYLVKLSVKGKIFFLRLLNIKA